MGEILKWVLIVGTMGFSAKAIWIAGKGRHAEAAFLMALAVWLVVCSMWVGLTL